jgi:RNA polymerase sigma factor (sigma-70 family)
MIAPGADGPETGFGETDAPCVAYPVKWFVALGRSPSDALLPVRSAAASPNTLEGASPEQLMAAYVDGDSAAFDALYQMVGAKVFGYLIRLTRQRERAEDLLQITFAKLHRARASYIRGAPFLPWLFAIARRAFLDERRRSKSRHEDLSADGTLPEPVPELSRANEEVTDALEQALDRLPVLYREAIVLTKITGLSVSEAAEVLGTTPTAVKLRVHRGYKELRQHLEAYQRPQ